MMTKISIIIPVYNVYRYLEKCLDSCISQSLEDIEIIIVNDGSTDKSADIINDYANRYPHIIPIHQKNSGVVKARAKGLEIASGEYIFYLDGDDCLPEDTLVRMYTLAVAQKSDIVFGDINSVDEEYQLLEIINYGSETLQYGQALLTWILENKVGYLWGKLIKKELYHKNKILRFYDMKYCEDLIEILQLSNFAGTVSKTNLPVYNYIQREGSVCKSDVDLTVSADRYNKILSALKDLIDSKNFLGEALAKLKQLYLFYAVLFLWFSRGYKGNGTETKLNILSVFKTEKNFLWKENKKWFFLTYCTLKFPKIMSKGYMFFINLYSK